MRTDEDGSAAAASAPATRFAGTLMDVLDRVQYSRVPMDVTDNPVYRLRYEAYRREEFVPFNDAGVVVDDLDTTPNASCFAVHIDGELVSSLRLHLLSSRHPSSPSMKVFPDVLGPLLAAGQRFIDPSRFTADYEASLAYPALPFLTLRIAVMATIHYRAHNCLALVRPEHAPFYRRVLGSEPMGGVRPYPGLPFPVVGVGAPVESARDQSIFSRFPFFLSTAEEREKLFGSAGDDDVSRMIPASSRAAYELAVSRAHERQPAPAES